MFSKYRVQVILTDACYNEKSDNKLEVRKRIIKAAAIIVTEDIRSKVYETNHYPPSDNFFQDVESDIPETLRIFLDGIILKNKRASLDKWKKKSIALAHSIIAATRPKSFISSEQINDNIEKEEDHDETDDPIVDDAEETSVFDISIGIEDDEDPTPGPSRRMKRRKLT